MVRWREVRHSAELQSIELFVAFASIILGLALLLSSAFSPLIIVEALPLFGQKLWAVTVLGGGILNGAGILFSNLYVRRAGLLLLAGASFTVFLAIVVPPFDAFRLLGSVTYFIAALAFWARYRVVGKWLNFLKYVANMIDGEGND